MDSLQESNTAKIQKTLIAQPNGRLYFKLRYQYPLPYFIYPHWIAYPLPINKTINFINLKRHETKLCLQEGV